MSTRDEGQEIVDEAVVIARLGAKAVEKLAPDIAQSCMALMEALYKVGFTRPEAIQIVAASMGKK